jgi:ADP-ribose pyrophosphatase YjhB (NUDIX family)
MTQKEPKQALWPRIRGKLFHAYFLFRRPMTLGVRAFVFDEANNRVFLIRHTYVPGWQMPGGGVETGETFGECLAKELAEEGNIELTGEPCLFALYFNRQTSKRDHVALYVCKDFVQTTPKLPDHEIAESGFFALTALPEDTTPATRRRIEEITKSVRPAHDW